MFWSPAPLKPGGWVRLQPRRVPLGNPGVGTRGVGRWGSVLASGNLWRPARLYFRGDEWLHDHRRDAALGYGGRDTLHPLLAQHEPVARGIVVLVVTVAPTPGFGAARLLGAEVSGVAETRFTPRIADTAKALPDHLPGADAGRDPRPASRGNEPLRRGSPLPRHRGYQWLQPEDRLHSLL